ncbi:transglutaminase-like domain-containing protein [uncultured Sunxiuqinia sp.]|uniref:transglutaminase-like domain-containing protein n=1 Tax=uncultured Sunxiuqinia sp. TaxID=1573825 RepID=UPI00262356DD|nr:transglutaminase-like domain-containing protein [uncultured Sunxiuqinia sp.]
MKNDRLQALIALLDDPDETVFEAVEQQLLCEDARIVDQLEQIWETSLDELIQNRIENLIQQIQFAETRTKILNWANQKQIDLFEGFFLISQYQYPDLKLKQVRSKLQKISNDVWLEISNKLTSLEKITVLNHIFYDTNQFSVNLNNLNSPQNCYLNQILETKKGNAISIAILYALIARELKFPVQFINFPKTPLLAYIDPELAKEVHGKDYKSSILFYINPSNKGAIIGRKEIDFFLNKNDQYDINDFNTPCEDKLIIKKLLESLIESYDSLGYQDKVDDLGRIADFL